MASAPPLAISVETESIEATKRQLRQRKPSDAKSPVPPPEVTPKIEIKREQSVQETETTQPMEGIDLNLIVNFLFDFNFSRGKSTNCSARNLRFFFSNTAFNSPTNFT